MEKSVAAVAIRTVLVFGMLTMVEFFVPDEVLRLEKKSWKSNQSVRMRTRNEGN